ncbi:MAG: hypothetical protein AB7N24_00395 [Dehalococcoidia bacterium]
MAQDKQIPWETCSPSLDCGAEHQAQTTLTLAIAMNLHAIHRIVGHETVNSLNAHWIVTQEPAATRHTPRDSLVNQRSQLQADAFTRRNGGMFRRAAQVQNPCSHLGTSRLGIFPGDVPK